MVRLGRASLSFNPLRIPVSLRSLYSSSPSSASTTKVLLPSRGMSTTVAESRNDIFNYTSGCWVYNDALRHQERRLAFDVDGLRRIAAESMNQSPDDVVSLSKLAEGGFNRGRPITAPKYYAVASEVATIEYLRSCGLPIPKIYEYSPDSDNLAGTAYIMMEFVQGSKLSEARMMILSFPAGGSLYFTKDLEKVATELGIPLDDKRFSIGPDVRLPLWYGRRENLDVNRGPYQSSEAVLIAAARKELAYLEQFGQPILPLRRERRPNYKYQQQLPSHHVKNLERYLDVVPSLVPRDPSLNRFCIRHPDLQQNNIIVSRSPDSGCKVVGLIDWQHTSILPMFLLVGIPQRLQNHDDYVSHSMTPPSRPENFDELNGAERAREEYLHRCRLVHFHYVTSTKECNHLHYTAFTDPFYALRDRLFQEAGAPWEGETFELKPALIQATKKWEELIGGGVSCPVEFDAEDLRETAVLNEELGWVLHENYEYAMAFLKKMKEKALAGAMSVEEQEEIMAQWPWDDMDESQYM